MTPAHRQHYAHSRHGLVGRDPVRQLLWLEEAAGGLGSADCECGGREYVARVLGRLALGDELYGDRWTGLGLEQLLTELEAEAADIGAWGVLARQVLDSDTRVSPMMRDHIAIVLQVAIRMGAYAYQALLIAREDLARQRSDEGDE